MDKHDEISAKILRMIKDKNVTVKEIEVHSDEEHFVAFAGATLLQHVFDHHKGDFREAYYCLVAKAIAESAWIQSHDLEKTVMSWINKRSDRFDEIFEGVQKSFVEHHNLKG